MESIVYIDRVTKKREVEIVYGAKALQFLYGNSLLSRFVGRPLLRLVSRAPFFSRVFGAYQKLPCTKKRIAPFIDKFNVDAGEFLEPIDSFASFNDFFIRKLKKEARPIASGDDVAIIPADARYLFFQDVSAADGFIIKGQKFSLVELLGDSELAAKYEKGAMLIARLCPTDYHRFHFPVGCVPEAAKLINGWLYSVNPIALKKNIDIFVQNKRTLTTLSTDDYGDVLFLEIGATSVGTIVQTYESGILCAKGDEKGYFSFGGSSLVILFPPDTITFDTDLTEATKEGVEIRCLLGQTLGRLKPRRASSPS